MFIEALTVSPENRLQGELIDKKWVIIDLMMGFWQISNIPHIPISPSPHLSPLPYSPTPLLSIYNFK